MIRVGCFSIDLPRSFTRENWKILYRMLRVAHRESLKVTMDAVLYGTGVMMVPGDGSDPKHIPIEEVTLC